MGCGRRASIPESVRIVVKDIGGVPDNLAVESVRADGERVVATVRNTAARPATSTRGSSSTDGRLERRHSTSPAAAPRMSAFQASGRPASRR
jgi:hypothetical protein